MKVQFGVLLSLFVACATSARPANITGGNTSVALDGGLVSTLIAAGITPAAVSPGTLMNTTATFPITGGDTGTGIINHSGGLSFTQGASSAILDNFVIDLNTMLLSGDVVANAGTPMMNVNLFNIGSGNTLTINSTLATDLSAVFGVPDLTGATVGVATVSPITASAVPEPSTFVFLVLGAVTVAGVSRLRLGSFSKQV